MLQEKKLWLATAFFFILQLFHLYWLTTDVVIVRLSGQDYFNWTPFWELLITMVDYAEIPALIGGTILYRKNLKYLLLINSQWLHIFWITDEFVLDTLLGKQSASLLPIWLAWIAIAIDYLELPVIFDTIRKTIRARTL